jgi:hypothetical protein
MTGLLKRRNECPGDIDRQRAMLHDVFATDVEKAVRVATIQTGKHCADEKLELIPFKVFALFQSKRVGQAVVGAARYRQKRSMEILLDRAAGAARDGAGNDHLPLASSTASVSVISSRRLASGQTMQIRRKSRTSPTRSRIGQAALQVDDS